MGLWLLVMLLLVVVLLMCMRLGDLRPIIASFDGRRPCYRNGCVGENTCTLAEIHTRY